MKPTVSVLMPVHNAETTVSSAVRSIQRQTLADIEFLIVDDGSTDSTPAVLDGAAARDSRLRVLHLPNRGIIGALNAGLVQCSGDLIARMDADDVSHPCRLEMQADLMSTRTDISVCSCLVRIFPRTALQGGMMAYEAWLNSLRSPQEIARDMFVESPVAHPSVMVRRHELVEIGGYQERGWAEDYDLWLRYHAAGKCFAKVDRTLLFWRHAPQRLTFTDTRYSVENFLRAKAFYLSRLLEGSGRPIVLWGAGKMGRRLLKHLQRYAVEVRAVVDIDPNKIGHRLRGIEIVPADYLARRTGAFVIAAVGSARARGLIRQYLLENGFVDGQDFVCAA